ncbi:hypothetical protein POM88_051538 [Heracleum sosnowskyi]|uniref:TF-B3 domain-containing protein n=1 Tax=Heracleum sosnowskyi TaxID=360622 RepID=A0AAD8GZP1_9APIA|nr:hypothetical protein POM88_051538 [Heracleum sosnowskyi]
MANDRTELGMICLISGSDYEKGQLEANFTLGSLYIEGLKSMMSYYCLRPYHMVVLYYVGGAEFNVRFYTPYVVEMKYPTADYDSESDVIWSSLEEEKLCSTYHFNAVHNFVGVYNLHIESEQFVTNKVLSGYACDKIGLSPSVKSIRLCFEDHEWRIRLKWVDGDALFGKTWYDFVEAAKLVDGDLLALYKTGSRFKFKVSVFDKNTVCDEYLGGGVSVSSSYANFFKVMTSECLAKEELELPRVFKKNYGHTLGEILHIDLGGAYSTKFKYCAASKKIHGLIPFIGKYDIQDDFVMFFNYLGNSTFAISVNDRQCMNHFRDNLGYLRYEDFMNPRCDTDVVVLSDDSEDSVTEDSAEEMDHSSDVSSETEEDNEDVVEKETMAFNVVLKKSHIHQRCHGAYIPTSMWHIYRSWGRRTEVTLVVGEKQWTVEVMRNKKVCRFGIGWDVFTSQNTLLNGQEIVFQFTGNFTFQVTV